MKAHSILSCVITAMEDEEVCTGDGPYWPSVIESASLFHVGQDDGVYTKYYDPRVADAFRIPRSTFH